MSFPDDDGRLRDMREYARRAIDASQLRSRDDLSGDRVFAAAMERFVEIIGEAAQRTSRATREQLPAIPWNEIIGMRNRLVHAYVAVDYDVLWQAIRDDLPLLVAELDKVLP